MVCFSVWVFAPLGGIIIGNTTVAATCYHIFYPWEHIIKERTEASDYFLCWLWVAHLHSQHKLCRFYHIFFSFVFQASTAVWWTLDFIQEQQLQQRRRQQHQEDPQEEDCRPRLPQQPLTTTWWLPQRPQLLNGRVIQVCDVRNWWRNFEKQIRSHSCFKRFQQLKKVTKFSR